MAQSYNGTLEVPSFIVTETKPLDVRTVVNSVEDLTNGSISNLYTGIVVNIKGTADLYILIGATRKANLPESWAKVGGSFDPALLAEYAKKEDLLGFLSASDVEDFVKIEDINDILDGFVAESDLDLYVRVEDILDFVRESDLEDYAKKEDLEDYAKNEDLDDYAKNEDLKDYAKKEDLEAYLTSSDAEEFVRLDEISDILSEELAGKFVEQSDLDIYVKTEDLNDYVTSSDLDARLAEIVIPENVSAFVNDAGYLTDSDLDGYARYEDLLNYLTSEDLDDYVKVEVLEDYIPKSELEELVIKSDLDGYVKKEDAIEYLTSSDLDDYLKVSELPTRISEFDNDAGYLTEADLPDFLMESDLDEYVRIEDLEDYIPKSELENLATKSELEGYVRVSDAIYYLTSDDLDAYAKTEDILTSNGSAPLSGNGFSISSDDPDAIIEETYVDNGFEPNQYYTGRGLNSSDDNGTGSLGDVEYITLSNGGDSYIRLNSADDDNWIEINIADDTLGLSMSDITYLDENGDVHTMESSPLVLPKETPVSFGENGFDFAGLTETREDDPTEYVFGEDGSSYEDVDIYSSSALPTVYAYSDGNPVRVLTEGDKVEIINMVENASVERISDEEILSIF